MKKIVFMSLACTFYMLNVMGMCVEAKNDFFDVQLHNPIGDQVKIIKEKYSQELEDSNSFLTSVCKNLSQTIAQNFAHIDINNFDNQAFVKLSKRQAILLAILYIQIDKKHLVLEQGWFDIFQSIPADVITLTLGNNFNAKIIPESEIPALEFAYDDIPPLERCSLEDNKPKKDSTLKKRNRDKQEEPDSKKAKI